MTISNLSVIDEGLVKLRNLSSTYKEFVVKYREVMTNHTSHVDLFETTVKGIAIDPVKFKALVVSENITYANWKLYWEGVIRFSEVLSSAAVRSMHGDNVDLSSMFGTDILGTIGIKEFSFNPEGKLTYSKLNVVRDSQYEMNLVGTSRTPSDWDKTPFLNQKLPLDRMMKLSKLAVWDDILSALDTNIKYINLNMKKDTDTAELVKRFYMCFILVDFASIMYDSMYKLMNQWLRIGAELINCRK